MIGLDVSNRSWGAAVDAYAAATGKTTAETIHRGMRNFLYQSRQNVIRLTPMAAKKAIRRKLYGGMMAMKIINKRRREQGQMVSINADGSPKAGYVPSKNKALFKSIVQQAKDLTKAREAGAGYVKAGFAQCAVDLGFPIRFKGPKGKSYARRSYGKASMAASPVITAYNAVPGSGEIAGQAAEQALEAVTDDMLKHAAKKLGEAWK